MSEAISSSNSSSPSSCFNMNLNTHINTHTYTSVQFLIFALERCMKKSIDDGKFFALVSSKCYVLKTENDKLFIPYAVRIGKDKISLKEISTFLGHLPVFKINVNKDKGEISAFNVVKSSIMKDDVLLSEGMRIAKTMNIRKLEVKEVSDETKEILETKEIKYDEYDENEHVLVLPDLKTIITNLPLIMIDEKYKDYECIHEAPDIYYSTIMDGDKTKNKVQVIGYYIRIRIKDEDDGNDENDGKVIDIETNAEDHLAIIVDERDKDTKIVDLMA